MHRPTIGILAVLLFVAAVALWPFSANSSSMYAMFSACIRVGILMSVAWLAQPHLKGFPWWLVAIVGFVLAAILMFKQPRSTLVLLAVVIIALRVRDFLARSNRPPKSQ